MSKNITFECNDESTSLFVDILSKLYNSNGRNLKIRVGGEEYNFVGDIDSVTNILVDGNPLSNTNHSDLVVMRANALNARAPVVPVFPIPTFIPISAPVTPTSDSATDPSSSNVPTPVTSDANDASDVLQGALADSVSNIVTGKINAGRMFTAFDITKELRQTGTQVNHGREVRPIIHAMWNSGLMPNYTRGLVAIGSNQAFVYHPISSDPTAYNG
jgi:hypothetical protein